MEKIIYDCLIPNGRIDPSLTIMSILQQKYLPNKIILVDNKKNASGLNSYIYNIALFYNVDIEYHKISADNTIAKIRYNLLQRTTAPNVLFIDDDVVLDRNYINNIFDYLVKNPKIKFAHGLRLEVGGRENDNIDINEMNNINAATKELSYGDTFAFFGDTTLFKTIPNWEKILENLKYIGTTGEDVLIGNYLVKHGYKIIGINTAIAFHLASANFSYWNTFLASDAIRKLNFKELI